MSSRNIRILPLIGGLIVLISSFLPWYSISAEITILGNHYILSLEAFLWGISARSTIPSAFLGASGSYLQGTSNYLELMNYVPSEYKMYLYLPLALLAISVISSILTILRALRTEAHPSRTTGFGSALLSLASPVIFAISTYVAYSQIAHLIPISVNSPLFGTYSTSISIASLNLSWGLSYGWIGSLAGTLISAVGFILSRGQPSAPPAVQPQPARQTAFCNYCGAEIAPGALFCNRCGRKQEHPS